MSSLKPLADRIVAEALEAEEQTASGFYLPDDAQEKPQMAKVVAVGKDVEEVQKGQTVIHAKFGTNEVSVDGDEYLILKEEDVLAVIE